MRDIERGKLRILVYGNPLSGGKPDRDVESGLPVRILIDCCVTEAGRRETEAYNRAMRDAAKTRTPR